MKSLHVAVAHTAASGHHDGTRACRLDVRSSPARGEEPASVFAAPPSRTLGIRAPRRLALGSHRKGQPPFGLLRRPLTCRMTLRITLATIMEDHVMATLTRPRTLPPPPQSLTANVRVAGQGFTFTLY